MRKASMSELLASMTPLIDSPEGSGGLSAVDRIQGLVVLGQLHAYSTAT